MIRLTKVLGGGSLNNVKVDGLGGCRNSIVCESSKTNEIYQT
jgi:hypothetical protein